MKNRVLLAGIAAVFLALSACAKNSPPDVDTKNAVAMVDGKPISYETYKAYLEAVLRKPIKEASKDEKDKVLEQFIAMHLAAQVAAKHDMDTDPEVRAQLALSKMNVLSEAALKKYLADHPISDSEIKAEYDTQVAAMGRQYHVHNILLDSKAAAESVIAKLKAGANFADLAKKMSTDPGAKNGGDMGWLPQRAMLPEFANAITGLDKGKFTLEPVHTKYGWHVIKLDDYRTPEPPEFDKVKEQVKNIVQRKKLQAYLEELRKAAKVEITLPQSDAEKAPADDQPAGDK